MVQIRKVLNIRLIQPIESKIGEELQCEP